MGCHSEAGSVSQKLLIGVRMDLFNVSIDSCQAALTNCDDDLASFAHHLALLVTPVKIIPNLLKPIATSFLALLIDQKLFFTLLLPSYAMSNIRFVNI